MGEKTVIARMSPIARQEAYNDIGFPCFAVLVLALVLAVIFAGLGIRLRWLPPAVFLILWCSGTLKIFTRRIPSDFRTLRQGGISVWVEDGFLKMDGKPPIPITDIRGAGYDYARNGSETTGSFMTKAGREYDLDLADYYDIPVHEILKRVADIARLERAPDLQYRQQGRWTRVTWGQVFDGEPGNAVELDGFERP